MSADLMAAAGRRLLIGGLLGAGAVMVPAGLVLWPVVSARAGLSYVTGSLLAAAAMAVGQLSLTSARRLGAAAGLVVALTAYLTGLGGAVAGLVWASRSGHLTALWVCVGVAAGAYAYLAGVIIAYRKARVPVFLDDDDHLAGTRRTPAGPAGPDGPPAPRTDACAGPSD